MRKALTITVGALALLSGCASGGDGTTPVAEGTTTTTTAEATTTTSRPPTSRTRPPTVSVPPVTVHTSTPRPSGVSTATPGQTLFFGVGGVPSTEITVESVERYTETRADYGEPPVNGQFVVVTLVVRADDTTSELVRASFFDFYMRDAQGNRWDSTDGNGSREDSDTRIDVVELNPGEQVRGTITFDVTPSANEFVYAPDSRAIGVWAIP